MVEWFGQCTVSLIILLKISILFRFVDISTATIIFSTVNHGIDLKQSQTTTININHNIKKVYDVGPTTQPTYYQSHHTQITTLAGDKTVSTYSGNGLSATQTSLNKPRGVWGDSVGNIFIAEEIGNKVRIS